MTSPTSKPDSPLPVSGGETISSDAPSLRESPDLAAKPTLERVALYMCATHCQGGHSDAGFAAAMALGVPFPLTMPNLIKRAREEGLNPAELWRWMIPAHQARNAFFTAAEIEDARKPAPGGEREAISRNLADGAAGSTGTNNTQFSDPQ